MYDGSINPGSPQLTVLMPVFNAERYLTDAIKSVLAQTYRDFELLIIDDGSTDSTARILASFDDPRIRIVRNPINIGVTRSLNFGIDAARGTYIARMDADDIARPQRLLCQARVLDENPSVAVVASKIIEIDASGVQAGVWPADVDCVDEADIHLRLPRENCIAHPSVMMRTHIAREYRYDERHEIAQDYDLWLRLSADGRRIVKLDEPLVLLRIHSSSVTASSSRTVRPREKNVRTRLLFLKKRCTHSGMNLFEFRVMCFLILDMMILGALMAWRKCQYILLGSGRCIGSLFPLGTSSRLFFFFPFYHIGGGERVHAAIVSCFVTEKPRVFFTNRSKNRHVRKELFGDVRSYDVWPLTRIMTPLAVGFMAAWINRHAQPVVFGGNSRFFYELLPHLRPDIRAVDIIHALGSWVDKDSLASVIRLNERVVITPSVRTGLAEIYRQAGLVPECERRICLVPNAIEIPANLSKSYAQEISVLYVGRGSEEKCVDRVARIASLCGARGVYPVFTLVGDVRNAIPPEYRASCLLVGELTPSAVVPYYRDAHILLITSRYEGFPLAVMEGMSYGAVPICTAVGGIPDHVKHGDNGFLVDATLSEDGIVSAFSDLIAQLLADRGLLEYLSRSAYLYARTNFGYQNFCTSYRNILYEKKDEV